MIRTGRLITQSILIGGAWLALLLYATIVEAKAPVSAPTPAKVVPYNNEYSISASALKGPDNTEVTVSLATTNPSTFPIPAVLEKLQIKIKNDANDVVYIVNEKDAAVSNAQVVRLVGEPGPHQTLTILAQIKTGTRTVVLKADALVRMRPDLVIHNVSAPGEVNVNQAFNIDVTLRETNNMAVQAKVSLYVDGNLSAAYPNVQVNAAGMTTVVFAGLSFADPGSKNLSAVISNAVPGEYNTANNEHNFAVVVKQPVTTQPTNYYLYYDNYNNYDYHYWNTYSCDNYNYDDRQTGSFDYLYLQGDSYGEVPSGSIDEIKWETRSPSGVAASGSIANLAPYYSDSYNSYYQHYDQASGTYVYVYAYPMDGYTYFYYYEYSGSYVYVYSYYGNTYTQSENWGPHMNAQGSVTATLLIKDETVSIGGSATAIISAPIHYADSYSYDYYDYYCGWYTYGYDYSYDYSYGYSSGLMDPPVVSKVVATAALPDRVRLGRNYPNPFNPATTIEFALPTDAKTTLSIYNLLGEKVATLVDGFQPAGYYKVQFDASEFGSGMYLYVLESGSSREVQKMTLLK